MDISVASALLVTHSRFADVYSLFEETQELLPESKVKEFMADVGDIRSRLDRWKTLFSYEKEKKTFLVAKCHARSVLGSGRDELSQEGFSSTGSSCETPRSRASSEQRLSSSLNNGTPTPEDSATLDDTLPLVLENESDETWLFSAPPPPIPAQTINTIVAPEEKTTDSFPETVQSSTRETQTMPSTPSKPIQSKNGSSSLKSRIPKPPPSPKRGVFDETAMRNCH